MNRWLQALTVQDLISEAPQLSIMELGGKYSLEDIADFASAESPPVFASIPHDIKERLLRGEFFTRAQPTQSTKPSKAWWPLIRAEFDDFLCTDSEKYFALRDKVRAASGHSGTLIISTISAGIAATLGFQSAVISSFVAICLYAPLKFGKEAYCRSRHET
ncbi:MAG TPA: hypothetical protein PJ986_16155 [Gammaproteobacteria bacterium]|nr:hypothetical protein [Gammaproteobacteria bacterium]